MKKLSRTTLTNDAYEVIRVILLEDGRFEPGQKISMELIARELGVSRSPVWSAIARLEVEGLVDVNPRQGVFLATFDVSRLNSLFELREALEGMAARLAAARMTDAEILALRGALESSQSSHGHGIDNRLEMLDFTMHQLIMQGTKSPSIMNQLQNIYDQIRIIYKGKNRDLSAMDVVRFHSQHRTIVDAIAQRDEDASESLGRAHVQCSRRALVDRIS